VGTRPAFIVLAFLSAERDDLAKRALRWLPTAQEPASSSARWTGGSLAPSWCRHQLDETGAILFAYDAGWRHRATTPTPISALARRAADFLLGRSTPDGLPVATADLWEEREGRHASPLLRSSVVPRSIHGTSATGPPGTVRGRGRGRAKRSGGKL
jgi:GH15 family glucan-1,4-alpha-glucosidase